MSDLMFGTVVDKTFPRIIRRFLERKVSMHWHHYHMRSSVWQVNQGRSLSGSLECKATLKFSHLKVS